MRPRSVVWICSLSILLTLLSACGTARKETYEGRTPAGLMVGGYLVPAPVMRIGFEESASSTVTVSCRGGLVLFDQVKGRAVSTNRFLNQVSFFVARAAETKPGEIYRVQIASLSDERRAKNLADKVGRELGIRTVVRFSSQTRTYRVQVGESPTRDAARPVERKLHAAGYRETWITSEKTGATRGGLLAAVDGSGQRIASSGIFRCAPARPGALLVLGGQRYRGAFEFRQSNDGRVLPINIVNLDQYLRGVVPAEMSPTVYPQLDALKAQAVAARTYAVKNRNQYSREGFDICESARCQVYKGADVEHALTNQAIQETIGEVITYDGEPVNALFTSTCGGHTEDVENIFSGDSAPYLRGVVCEPEAAMFSKIASGPELKVTYGSDGMPLDYELAALAIAGILPASFVARPSAEVTSEQWRSWATHVASLLGVAGRRPPPSDSQHLTLRQAIELLVDTIGWEKRIRNQVSDGDLQILEGFEGLGELSPEVGRPLLYFLRLGVIGPEPDGRLGFEEPLRQTNALRMLNRLLELENSLGAVEGQLVKVEGSQLVMRAGAKVQQYEITQGVRLFKRFAGYCVPVRTLQMTPGDRISLNMRQDSIGAIVHEPSLEGIASDRTSRYFQWDVSYSPGELEDKVERYADVGLILELRPLRYGVSERVVELEVVGDAGSAVLKGLQIRWALGLRENLFVIEKKYGEVGNVKTWRFIGKGWGHGVGLCQVGASGMAIAGSDYIGILEHYYSGIRVEKIY